MKKKRNKPNALQEIKDYDELDSSKMVDASKPLQFEDLGLKLPKTPPTQVISIRLPSKLLNEIRALGSARDIPYQALIKLFLSESLLRRKKKFA